MIVIELTEEQQNEIFATPELIKPSHVWIIGHSIGPFYLVQLYEEDNPDVAGHVQVQHLAASDMPIGWDDLQEIKRAMGFGDAVAVEVYPPESDIINEKDMRHLWVLNERPSYVWKRTPLRFTLRQGNKQIVEEVPALKSLHNAVHQFYHKHFIPGEDPRDSPTLMVNGVLFTNGDELPSDLIAQFADDEPLYVTIEPFEEAT